MPRSVEITVPPDVREALLDRLDRAGGVAAILVHPGAAHRPPGDVVIVRGTNRAAESAVAIAGEMGLIERGCVAIVEPVGLVSGAEPRHLENDSSEASWEEILTLLRRDSNPSRNVLAMMALSGALAGGGLYLDTLHIVIGAMLVAPAFEPLVRVTVGVGAGNLDAVRQGAVATLGGYAALAFGGAVGLWLVALAEPGAGVTLTQQHWIRYWTAINWSGVAIAVMAGLAGAVVVNSHQTVFATGVIIALALIPTMAIFGMGLSAGEFGLALRALVRWLVEVACVLAASGLFFAAKRAVVRRRAHT